jgi:hypothetical protein
MSLSGGDNAKASFDRERMAEGALENRRSLFTSRLADLGLLQSEHIAKRCEVQDA